MTSTSKRERPLAAASLTAEGGTQTAEFAAARVHPALAPFVRSLIGARVRGAPATRQLELPVAGTAVIVELAEHWRIGVDADAPMTSHVSFAGGLTLAPAVSEHGGDYDLVEFVLTPAGTAAVLGVPAAALAHDVVALDAVVGGEAGRLAERIAAHRTWAERLAVVERWLLARVGAADGSAGVPAGGSVAAAVSPDVGWALGRLDATGGRITIGTLQEELGCSRRHLATRFAQTVGTTPKSYAQLLRFTGAVARLRAGGAPADVAAACGYADQAHLTRHVRRFGATTPAALRREGVGAGGGTGTASF